MDNKDPRTAKATQNKTFQDFYSQIARAAMTLYVADFESEFSLVQQESRHRIEYERGQCLGGDKSPPEQGFCLIYLLSSQGFTHVVNVQKKTIR